MDDSLPKHPLPFNEIPGSWSLEIKGLVDRSLSFSLDNLLRMERRTLTDDFHCLEGWVAEDCHWEGIPLQSLLECAGLGSDARFVRISGVDEGYDCYVPIDQCKKGLIALRLNGVRLSPEHGGPARLVWPDAESECWQSVKWVTEIESVRDRPDEDPARRRAMSRLGQNA